VWPDATLATVSQKSPRPSSQLPRVAYALTGVAVLAALSFILGQVPHLLYVWTFNGIEGGGLVLAISAVLALILLVFSQKVRWRHGVTIVVLIGLTQTLLAIWIWQEVLAGDISRFPALFPTHPPHDYPFGTLTAPYLDSGLPFSALGALLTSAGALLARLTRSPSQAGFGIALIGCILVLFGTLLPWVAFPVPAGVCYPFIAC
jgi:hypothetical protein